MPAPATHRPGLRLIELPDDELMARAQNGDPRAFEAIVDRHAAAAFSLAYRICGRRETAEAIVQDTYLSLWRTGARYDRSRGSARSWVLDDVHRRAVARLRGDGAAPERITPPAATVTGRRRLARLRRSRREPADAIGPPTGDDAM